MREEQIKNGMSFGEEQQLNEDFITVKEAELKEQIKHLEDVIKKLEIENELMKNLLRTPATYNYDIR
jgi:hypothetical protein